MKVTDVSRMYRTGFTYCFQKCLTCMKRYEQICCQILMPLAKTHFEIQILYKKTNLPVI